MTTSLQQVIAVMIFNLRAILERLGGASAIIVGIACTVAVQIAVSAMADGLANSLRASAHPDRMVVMSSGAQVEANSTVSRDVVSQIAQAAALSGASQAISPEVLLSVDILARDSGELEAAVLRGVTESARTLRPEMKIVEGRWFQSGVREIVVGRAAREEFGGLNLGSSIRILGEQWVVTGIFISGGDVHESELIADANTLMTAEQRSTFSSVTVQLPSAAFARQFADSIEQIPGGGLSALSEPEYYEKQSQVVTSLIYLVARVVTITMSLGVVFAALNVMYSSVSSRTAEISTLRALGFAPYVVVISVLSEALVLALAGGCVGALLTWLVFDGATISTRAASGQLAASLSVEPDLVIKAVGLAALIGFIGGLFPALRSARIAIADGLKAR